MNIHLKYRTWHLDLSIHQRQPVLGVNSILPDGKHAIFWDFDKVPLIEVRGALLKVQRRHILSTIYMFESSVAGNYHAYCLTRVSWATLITILMETPGVDQEYIKIGFMRGYMTLRWTNKIDSVITFVEQLKSSWLPNIEWPEFQNFELYYTLVRKHHDNA